MWIVSEKLAMVVVPSVDRSTLTASLKTYRKVNNLSTTDRLPEKEMGG
jgi:hypothetical protein